MNPNWADLFKANLVKPAWADNAKETEIPFVVHAIDSCIGTNWRKDGNALQLQHADYQKDVSRRVYKTLGRLERNNGTPCSCVLWIE